MRVFAKRLPLVLGLVVCLASGALRAEQPEAPGLGDPGRPVALQVVAGANPGEPARLVGPDARLQLVVLAKFDSGQTRDWTQRVQYRAAPAGVVAVDSQGRVVPLADGRASIEIVAPENLRGAAEVTVARFADPPRVNFPNQIVPVFTKLGCNGGGCHGKSGGQNGFALSLLGFEPQEDYAHLVKEARGRRLSPAAPERSLLLLKASGALPHGGGVRLKPGSDEYQLVARWIRQGMPYGEEDDPVVTSLSVFPQQRELEPRGRQQLKVTAHYSDGAARDVTRQAQYDTNNKEMAEVSESGVVAMLGKPGQVAVMVRYQGQVAAFRAVAPLGAPVTDLPPAKNFIDERVFAKLVELGLPPSKICDDATFLRRATIDIAGRLPTLDEAKAFAADQDPKKRAKLVDRLLASADYAEYFALKWSAILRNQTERNQSRAGNYLFHAWIEEQMGSNRPYDEFVREILTATGGAENNPPAAWYGHVPDINAQVEDTAQLFLGVRIKCARCHHHPFEQWSQQDYWGLAAHFAGIQLDRVQNQGDYRVRLAWKEPVARNPKTNEPVWPTVLGGEPLEDFPRGKDPRARLADWMASPDNPFFAKALVNRYWKHFFDRGIVEPEDDMRATNPPSNGPLLDALAKHFLTSGYDLKDLIRTICNSTTYQLSAVPNEYNALDTQNFSRYYPRRLPAEVMLDGIDQFLGTTTGFKELPTGMRAVEIPDFGGIDNDFLAAFGRPAGASACECERGGDVTMSQCLQLLNAPAIHGKLSNSRAAELAGEEDRTAEEKITALYLRALARPPKAEELAALLKYLEAAEKNEKRQAYEDILWAVLNTKEFMFNH